MEVSVIWVRDDGSIIVVGDGERSNRFDSYWKGRYNIGDFG